MKTRERQREREGEKECVCACGACVGTREITVGPAFVDLGCYVGHQVLQLVAFGDIFHADPRRDVSAPTN